MNEKEEVVESDQEEEDDDYMISKAPLATRLPPKLLGKLPAFLTSTSAAENVSAAQAASLSRFYVCCGERVTL